MRIRRSLALATGASIATMLIATPALAQDAPVAEAAAQDDSGVAEIVVTAQRRAERLQDAPLSVTALSADSLDRARHRQPRRCQQLRTQSRDAPDQPPGGRRFGVRWLYPRRRHRRLPVPDRPRHRPLCRRRVHRAINGRPAQPRGYRAGRGAQGPAGHALRPQHDRRRDQRHHHRSAPVGRSDRHAQDCALAASNAPMPPR